MRQLSYGVRGRCRRHSTKYQLIRDSKAASDASHFPPSILADDEDMVDSVEKIVMLMLGG